jgi:hypothetical protein
MDAARAAVPKEIVDDPARSSQLVITIDRSDPLRISPFSL